MTDSDSLRAARDLVERYRDAPLGKSIGMIVLRLVALLVGKAVLTRAEFDWVMWGDAAPTSAQLQRWNLEALGRSEP